MLKTKIHSISCEHSRHQWHEELAPAWFPPLPCQALSHNLQQPQVMPQVWGRVAGKLRAGKDEGATAIRTEGQETLITGACFNTILYGPKLTLSNSPQLCFVTFPIIVIPYAFCIFIVHIYHHSNTFVFLSQNLFHCCSQMQGQNKLLDLACASVFVIAWHYLWSFLGYAYKFSIR